MTRLRNAQPRYDRNNCAIGVVHLGYGAFHRAHQAVYLDDYMAKTGDLRWGIAAINLRAADSAGFCAATHAQGGYILKTISPNLQEDYKLVSPHIAFADWATEPELAERLAARKSVHVITITITESGYILGADGSLDLESEIIQAELNGKQGRSIYAYLRAALKYRMQESNAPISILCCDNMRTNGAMLRANFQTYLSAVGEEELNEWTHRNVSFPCSMVDRITPRPTPALCNEIRKLYPGREQMAVHSESFIQWVLEDSFVAPFPDLSRVGVEIVGDVRSYEEAKIRILNGGHTGLCYLGALYGHKTFDETMRHNECRDHFERLEHANILPSLTLDLPFDKESYCEQITARFSNTAIADSLERICMDGYAKFPLFIVPTLRGCLAQGVAPRYVYESIASWYVFTRRVANGAMPLAYMDKNWPALELLLQSGTAHEFVHSTQLWAELPERYTDFCPDLISAIRNMEAIWLS